MKSEPGWTWKWLRSHRLTTFVWPSWLASTTVCILWGRFCGISHDANVGQWKHVWEGVTMIKCLRQEQFRIFLCSQFSREEWKHVFYCAWHNMFTMAVTNQNLSPLIAKKCSDVGFSSSHHFCILGLTMNEGSFSAEVYLIYFHLTTVYSLINDCSKRCTPHMSNISLYPLWMLTTQRASYWGHKLSNV